MSEVTVLPPVDPLNWQVAKEKAKEFAASQILPPHIKNASQALVIMQMGSELGMGPMQSLTSIDLIQGRLTLKAQLMRAKIFQKFPNCVFRPKVMTQTECIYEAARDKTDLVTEFKYTIEDATKAGLVKPGGGYQKNPTDMLIARCSSRAARTMFPDALLGIAYTSEEAEDLPPIGAPEPDMRVHDAASDEDKKWIISICPKGANPKEFNEKMHGKTREEILNVITTNESEKK